MYIGATAGKEGENMVPIAEHMEQAACKGGEYARHDRETKEKIGRTSEAISEVVTKCVIRMNRKYCDGNFKFAGFLLDNSGENPSLHPLLSTTPVEVRNKIKPLYAMAGSDFRRDCCVAVEGEDVEYWVTWTEGWRMSKYLEAPSFYLDRDRLMGYYHLGGAVVLAERGSPEGVFPPAIIEKDLLALNEKVITLLAAAAGIKPEDEKSETFPLLFRELKRIKAKEGK